MQGFNNCYEKFNSKSQVFKSASLVNLDHNIDRIKILMIDDNPKDIRLVNELLNIDSYMDFSFSGYTNSSEAIKFLENNYLSPDLIILDCVMPSVNGVTVLKSLREMEKTKNTPIIIHSSMYNPDNIMKCKDLEADAFFEKPLDIKSFEKFVREQMQSNLAHK